MRSEIYPKVRCKLLAKINILQGYKHSIGYTNTKFDMKLLYTIALDTILIFFGSRARRGPLCTAYPAPVPLQA